MRRPGLVERIISHSIRAGRSGYPSRCEDSADRAAARALAQRKSRRFWRVRRGRGQLFEVARVSGGQPILGFAGDNLERDAVAAHKQQPLTFVGGEQQVPFLGSQAKASGGGV